MSKSDKKKALRSIVQKHVDSIKLRDEIGRLRAQCDRVQQRVNANTNEIARICKDNIEHLQNEDTPLIFITEFDNDDYQIVVPAKNNEDQQVQVFKAERIK